MPDEERTELLNWAAEELGWADSFVKEICPKCHENITEWVWTYAGELHRADHLLGWPGLGLAAEAILDNDRHWSIQVAPGVSSGPSLRWFYVAKVWVPKQPFSVGIDEDPGLAGWRALRESLAKEALG